MGPGFLWRRMHDIHAWMHDQPPPWDDLRFFLAAARAGSLGGAGRALGLEQSTVSRRVASLERVLGSALFDRSRAGLTLTQLGRRLVVEAEAMETALGRALDLSSQSERRPEGLVRLAVSETVACAFLLPRVMPDLLAQHPGLRLDLVIGDTPADLTRREADLAVRFFLSRSGDLITRRVATLATGLLAERRLARSLAREPPTRWPWVSVWTAQGPSVEESYRLSLTRAPARVTMNSFEAQWAAVRAGLGVAVLPRALLGAELIELPCPDGAPPPALEVHLAVPRALRRVPRVAVVFEALAAAFARLERDVGAVARGSSRRGERQGASHAERA